jgi:transmembrane sensor
MTDNYNNIDELIARCLTGEQSSADESVLNNWLSESPDNAAYFRQIQRLWALPPVAQYPESTSIDTEAALRKVKSQFAAPPKAPARRFSIWYATAAAAAVALLVVAVFALQRDPVLTENFVALDQTTNNTLADGSVVSLNRNSTITTAFVKKQRRVKLKGEGYFSVMSDSKRPFVIEAAELETEVVGTKFNIDNQRDTNIVHVSVTEGIVRLRYKEQQELLTAGQQAIFDRRIKKIQRISVAASPNAGAFRNRVLVFDDTPLAEVVAEIEKVYGVSIALKIDDLSNCRLHVPFNNKPIEYVMEVIETTLSIKATKIDNQHYVLEGAGCQD